MSVWEKCVQLSFLYPKNSHVIIRMYHEYIPIDSLRLGSSDTFSSFPRKPLIVRNTLSRTDFSASTVSWQRAGRMRIATSDNKKYCCVAANARTPALRAGGNGSRMALINAEMRTFWRIWGWRCWAILPKQTVVFVLIPPWSSFDCNLAKCRRTSTLRLL
jgi:hypothetical protein